MATISPFKLMAAGGPNILESIFAASRTPGMTGAGVGAPPETLDDSLDLNALAPKFEDIYLEPLRPQSPLDRLLALARANVGMRRQQLVEQGRMGAQPLANRELADKAVMARLPEAQAAQIAFQGQPQAVQEVPNIGRRVDYDGGRAMLGRYGTGVATNVTEPQKNRTIEGIPAAEWFRRAASRQGTDNKFARAEATGKTDALGRTIMAGIDIPAGSDAGTERVMEAMRRKKA